MILGLLGSLALNVLLFGAIGVLGLHAAGEEGRVQEQYVALNRQGTQKVAILSIEGIILGGEGFFKHQIDRAEKEIASGELKAIVLRVNSPGGTVSGSDYMYHHLCLLRDANKKKPIPIVVSIGAVAASGGYYASMCVGDESDAIFAEPSTFTGSIGVIIPHYNVADLFGKWGYKETSVMSNPIKDMLSMSRKRTPEELKILQGWVDDGFTQFKDVVKQGRPKFRHDPAAVDKLATGQGFTTREALENGLIDKIGFVEDAVDRAIELAHLNKEDVQVVKYKAEPRLSDLLLGQESAPAHVDLATLLDAATPRAYYLFSGLPASWPEARNEA